MASRARTSRLNLKGRESHFRLSLLIKETAILREEYRSNQMLRDKTGRIGPSFSPHSLPHQVPGKALCSDRSSSPLAHLLAHENSLSCTCKIFLFFLTQTLYLHNCVHKQKQQFMIFVQKQRNCQVTYKRKQPSLLFSSNKQLYDRNLKTVCNTRRVNSNSYKNPTKKPCWKTVAHVLNIKTLFFQANQLYLSCSKAQQITAMNS